MSESYIDSIRHELDEPIRRRIRVAQAVDFLRGIVLDHATVSGFDSTLITREARPNQTDPSEVMWFELRRKGARVLPAEFDEQDTARYLVPDEAALKIASDILPLTTAFTITTESPDVLGHDGEPLPLAGVEGVLLDLHRYRAALDSSSS